MNYYGSLACSSNYSFFSMTSFPFAKTALPTSPRPFAMSVATMGSMKVPMLKLLEVKRDVHGKSCVSKSKTNGLDDLTGDSRSGRLDGASNSTEIVQCT